MTVTLTLSLKDAVALELSLFRLGNLFEEDAKRYDGEPATQELANFIRSDCERARKLEALVADAIKASMERAA
jgi:hypothetical protein